MKSIALYSIIFAVLSSCIEAPQSKTFEKLPPGQWRAIFKLTNPDIINSTQNSTDNEFKVKDYFELPFNFEIAYENDVMVGHLINGDERIKIENLHFGRDRTSAKDTFQMDFSAFNTKINAFYEENFIEGNWEVPYKENYTIPFLATYGQTHRFIETEQKNTYDFSGKWYVQFEYDDPDSAYPAIGEFTQNGKDLQGTFKTETGDYRYLSGDAYGDKLRLSVFDGAHAFLFSGSVNQDTIYGEFRSGKHYKCKWRATKNSTSTRFLKDPYEMTKKTTEAPIEFSFKSSDNNFVSINDKVYNGKMKLINVMGTWCPNCRDEINFLKEIRGQFPEIEIFSLAFERYRDENKALGVLQNYKKTMKFDWPLLLGGYADKSETSEVLSFVDKIYSYPTLLLVNSKNQIIDIHTGFYGPATPEYESFKKEYTSKLQRNLK